MKVKTTRFGNISINKEDIIQMPSGMLGYLDHQRFIILEHHDNSPFFWYQSVDDPALAFVITSPFLFKPDYSLDLEETIKDMCWTNDNGGHKIVLFIIVNIPKGQPHKMTGNFIGPLVINQKARQGIQMVLANSPYSHKFPLV